MSTSGRPPLEGIRVIDFGQYIAGPMAAMVLGDQGADVIRIDPPSVAGPSAPATLTLCLNQDKNNTVTLQSSTGNVENWETSPDNLTWTDLTPAVASSTLNISNTGTAFCRNDAMWQTGCRAVSVTLYGMTEGEWL